MSLTAQAIQYLQKKFPNASFLTDIKIRDDGAGPYIYQWNLFGVTQPTEDQVNQDAANAAANPPPVADMPSDTDKFKLIYNDMKNGTHTYVDAIDAAGGFK